jgi:hypothetical protein
MNTTTASKIPSQKTTPKNGSPTTDATDHPEQTAASTTSATPSVPTTPAADKKPVTVMLTESLHRKVKITAELSGISLSDLVEEQLKTVVKERLPGLLAKLDTDT